MVYMVYTLYGLSASILPTQGLSIGLYWLKLARVLTGLFSMLMAYTLWRL